MSRKSETFFDAITHLREDLIEEAQDYKFRKKAVVWRKFGSLAACVVLIMSIGVLAVLPRGCGSSGGGSNSSTAPSANPQDAPSSGDTAPPLYGDSGSGKPEEIPNGGDSENGAPSGVIESYQFTAIVVEVQDEAILVEPIEYDSDYPYRIPFMDLEVPSLAEGDWVTVTCAGDLVFTSNPPEVLGVQSIEKIDSAE